MTVKVTLHKYSKKVNLTASNELLNLLSIYLASVEKEDVFSEHANTIADEIYQALQENGYYKNI